MSTNRAAACPSTATRWKCGSPSRACATRAPTRRIGASRSCARCSTRPTRKPGPPRCVPTRAFSFSRAAWSAWGRCGAAEVAGNLRWGLTQNLGATATANPDFSQVEADVGQVTLNQRFALFYPEKRPFFLEGLEQFDTPNSLIYTRRIVQPVIGAKLAGKVGATGIAYLGAVDNSDQSATGAHPIYNMLRLRRDLGPTSTLGVAYTDRIDGDDYNRSML